MRVLNYNVLIKEIVNNGETTPEGVIVPETIKQGYEIAVVVAPWEDEGGEQKPKVKAGNLIAYHANSGIQIRIENEPCRFIMEANILAVLKEDIIGEDN
jgi:co-chaperonin GroES (HSP10)